MKVFTTSSSHIIQFVNVYKLPNYHQFYKRNISSEIKSEQLEFILEFQFHSKYLRDLTAICKT